MGLADSAGMLDSDDLAGDRINFMKTGVMHADLLTTVSPTYAKESLEPADGMGLEQELRARGGSVTGILNGVDYDEWSPEKDELIPHRFSANFAIALPTIIWATGFSTTTRWAPWLG